MQDLLVLGILPGTDIQVSFDVFLLIVAGTILTIMTIRRNMTQRSPEQRSARNRTKLTNYAAPYEITHLNDGAESKASFGKPTIVRPRQLAK